LEIVVSWMDERVNAAKGRTGILPVWDTGWKTVLLPYLWCG